jgi:hypothetical protein
MTMTDSRKPNGFNCSSGPEPWRIAAGTEIRTRQSGSNYPERPYDADADNNGITVSWDDRFKVGDEIETGTLGAIGPARPRNIIYVVRPIRLERPPTAISGV